MSGDDQTIAAARAALAALPPFAELANAPISRLGGLTNLVFHVDAGEGLVLRLPGKGTEEYTVWGLCGGKIGN